MSSARRAPHFREALEGALAGTPAEALSAQALSRLEALDELLVRWSQSIDLVGFRSEPERVLRYFAEPLAALPWVPPEGKALDIGSGGGSPALPLAIARPGLEWTLLEPRRKRSLFLDEAIRELGLGNAAVERLRLEDWIAGRAMDVITVRGVRLSETSLSGIAGELRKDGRFLWFGKEERLQEAVEPLRSRGLVGGGPVRLLAGSSASLLAVARQR